MRKYGLLVVCLLISSVFLCACDIDTHSPMIKSQRRLEKYLPTQDAHTPGTIDLSEGPKLRYNANFGPKDLSFDIKIINPYH